MKPVTFCCAETIAGTPEEIAAGILELERWSDFSGAWPLPGIVSADFERRTEQVTGTRIRVHNGDGSTHSEEIIEWDPSRRVVLRMADFSPPLSRMASHFIEEWRFTAAGDATITERCFSLYGRNRLGTLLLRAVAVLLRRGVSKHLGTMKAAAERGAILFPHGG